MKAITSILLGLFLLGGTLVRAQERKQENPAKAAGCKLRIDFASPGSGIDLKTYDAVKKMLDDNKLAYKEVPNGREGELYFCLPFTELKRKKKKAFLKELKSTVKAGQFCSVSEG